ncbi:hypothetical protein K501DRAFT_180104, partial [Backusella circina FSU 941]
VELHALGPVNLDKVREDFSQKINMIRNVCSQFETEVLGDVMKMGIGADPAFRKHFTHLKEQATLESTVMRVKETLKNTKKYLEKSIKDKEESKSKIEVQRLEKLAQSMGLVTFVDSSQKIESGTAITTITLGGTVIVVDIDIDDTGHILRTKLTYVSETLQNDQDERVDTMLAKNLQARDFALFRRNLGSLALLDQLNVKHTPVDFFSIVKNLLYDLRTICQQELVIKSDGICGVLMEGHGIPCLHLDYPGISICYWIDQHTVYKNNWDSVKGDFEGGISCPSLSKASKLLISFEESIQPMFCLSASKPHYLLGLEETEDSVKEWENGEYYKVVYESVYPKFGSPLRFIKLLPDFPNVTSIPIRFTATLDPPVPVSDEICQLLMKSASLTKSEATFTSTIKSSSLSLEEILVKGQRQSMLLLSFKHDFFFFYRLKNILRRKTLKRNL